MDYNQYKEWTEVLELVMDCSEDGNINQDKLNRLTQTVRELGIEFHSAFCNYRDAVESLENLTGVDLTTF